MIAGCRPEVWIRIKPTSLFDSNSITIERDNKCLCLHLKRPKGNLNGSNKMLSWAFPVDGVLHNTSQDQVYCQMASSYVEAALNGYNATIMCCGQAGSGKTYTMSGLDEIYYNRGIIPRAISHIFRSISIITDRFFTIKVSYLEIYNERLIDLLGNNCQICPELDILELNNCIVVRGLNSPVVTSEEQIFNYLFKGELTRARSPHHLNQISSRSHTIFTIYIESKSTVYSDFDFRSSKISFVDLAGSERLQKSPCFEVNSCQMSETLYINKSLTHLEHVVLALTERGRCHVPFRQSKLTHYLRDSLGGQSYLRVIGNIWGDSCQIEETLSTMRFVNRLMKIKIQPFLNCQMDKNKEMFYLRGEVEALGKELKMHDVLANRSGISYEAVTADEHQTLRKQITNYMRGKLPQLEIRNYRQVVALLENFKHVTCEMLLAHDETLRSKYEQSSGTPLPPISSLIDRTDQSNNTLLELTNDKNAANKNAGVEDVVLDKDENVDDVLIDCKPSDQLMTMWPCELPSKVEQFEVFKNDCGAEIKRILLSNKNILALKKRDYSNLAKELNKIKMEIDSTSENLASVKLQRMQDGIMTNDDGEIVISEEEYELMKKMTRCKSSYHLQFNQLGNLKYEIGCLKKYVQMTRSKLLQEFDAWYAQSFLNGTNCNSLDQGFAVRPGVQPSSNTIINIELISKTEEKLQMMRERRKERNPDAYKFYSAKHNVYKQLIPDSNKAL